MLAILIAAAIVFLIAITPHAVERHGADALSVRACLDGGPPLETWQNPTTGRQADICQIDNLFGLQISENGKEVTSFVKEKLKTMAQVRKYLENRGYIP